MTVRLGVNAAILDRGTSGSARATRDLVAALGALPGVAVEQVRPRPWPLTAGAGRQALRGLRWVAWDMRGAARAGVFDGFVSPCNTGLVPRRLPHLLVVYDTMVFDHPELYDPAFVRLTRALVPVSVRAADVVVTMTERSRRRLQELFGDRTPVEVLPWRASGDVRAPAAEPPTSRRVLMLGATSPVKRHTLGIRAVHEARRLSGLDLQLDVVGPAGRSESAVGALLAELDPDRSWTRRHVDLPGQAVHALLDAAWVLLQPSLDEGFGLPLLEAAERGIPVVHSGRGAMPEVLPEAGAARDDAAGLAAALLALEDPAAWRARAGHGGQQAARLSPAAFQARVGELATQAFGIPTAPGEDPRRPQRAGPPG